MPRSSNSGYAWDPKDYGSYSLAQYRWAAELLDKLALLGQEAVLDLGCGDGKVTAHIAGRLPQGEVLGVDSSSAMVDHARKEFPSHTHPNLAFERADATALNYAGRFDLVFSNAALHWVSNHDAVLAGIHRALNEGGRLLFQRGGKGNAAGMLDTLARVLRQDRWAQAFAGFQMPYTFLGRSDYRALLQSNGFQAVRVELINKKMEHAGTQGLAGWLRTAWMPYVHRVPETDRPTFIDEVVARYVERFGIGSRGAIQVEMIRLEVEAIRES